MYQRVKKAAVALVMMHERRNEPDARKAPFTIIGSGFCIHESGVIATCQHVLSSFMSKSIPQQVAEAVETEPGNPIRRGPEVDTIVPFALFFDLRGSPSQLVAFPVRAGQGVAKSDYDLGLVRLHPHAAFPSGFPTLEIEDYEQVQEGMEIATCGFPLGNYLGEQIGTITSSFTRGIVSSIIPAAGVPIDYLKGFQLNLTATHGNSGGPVFSLASGKVFGVLQRAIATPQGQHFHGMTKAEPIYPLLQNNLVQRLLDVPPGQLPPFS